MIANWRSAHSYPLHAISMTLRNRAKRIDERAIVARRLERLPSMELKLTQNPAMQLSQMQDIGGCRAVVRSVTQLRELVKLFETERMNHELVEPYDYLGTPKHDGYRGVHPAEDLKTGETSTRASKGRL